MQASLTNVPTDEQVVVYCYTGHTGAAATCILNVLGYDAVNMKYRHDGVDARRWHSGGVAVRR